MVALMLEYRGRKYRIWEGNCPFKIGGNSDNDLQVDVDVVSGFHARVLHSEAGFVIEDLRSTNGTTVLEKGAGERKLGREGLLLSRKGLIKVGGSEGVELAYEIEDTASPHAAESLLEDAVRRLENGDYEGGGLLAEEAIRARPDDAAAYYYAGFAASRCEKLEKACLRFEQYLLFRPDCYDVKVDLGKIYERAGDVENARACFQNTLSRIPGHPEAKRCLDELTRFEAATPASSRQRKTRDVLGDQLLSTVDMPPFRVRYFVAAHGRILNDVLKGLKTSWEDIGKILGCYPSKTILVDLIKPHLDVAGTTGPEGIVLALDQEHLKERPFLSVLVSHEYAHYALGTLTKFSPRVPWWMHEGFAQHVSQNLSPARLVVIRDWIRKDRLIPLDDLEKGLRKVEDNLFTEIAYAEAHTAVAFLAKKLGEKEFRRLLGSMNRNGLSKAFKRVGDDYGRFQSEWVTWLSENIDAGGTRVTKVIRSG